MSCRPTPTELAAALRREKLDRDEIIMKKDAVVINSYTALTRKVKDQAAEIEALREQVEKLMKFEPTLNSLSRQSSSFVEADSEDLSSASESVIVAMVESKESSLSNSVEDLGVARDGKGHEVPKVKDMLHEWHADGTRTPLFKKGLPASTGLLMSTST